MTSLDQAAERLATELRKSIRAEIEVNRQAAEQLEALIAERAIKAKAADFHRHTDRIVDHYAEEIRSAMAQVFQGDTIRHAIRVAYGSQTIAKAKGDPIRQRALDAVKGILDAAKRSVTGLIEALRRLYGDGSLQGSHWAAEAADGWVTGSLASVEAEVPEDYWDDWKPGWGEAAALAANGGLAGLLADADVTVQGITDTLLDRIGNAIADAVAAGDGVKEAGKRVEAIIDDPKRAWLIADTECARAMVAAALQQYDELGIEEWDWLTVADPCPACAAEAASNPHAVDAMPRPPKHPRCRCSAVAHLEDADE